MSGQGGGGGGALAEKLPVARAGSLFLIFMHNIHFFKTTSVLNREGKKFQSHGLHPVGRWTGNDFLLRVP